MPCLLSLNHLVFTTSLYVDIVRYTDVDIDKCQDACWNKYSETPGLSTSLLTISLESLLLSFFDFLVFS